MSENDGPSGLAVNHGSQDPGQNQPTASPPLDQQQPQHALPQQQHPVPPQHQAPQVPPLQSNSDGTYKCQWVGCTEFHPSPEQLYDHVCDKHIGRKSTNNLNLQCAWANCHVQVVKRDHITSHIRVHVPLKPHRCQFCGKTFKRPQDLKKHVKTHADDSMINGMNQASSSDGRHPHPHQNGGYNMGPQHKGPGYYPDPHHQMPQAPYAPPMGYQHQGHGGAPSYYGPSQQQQGPGNGYGTVSYVGQGGNASYDSGKSMASLSSFLGEIQRGAIDTKSYTDVTSRLAPLQTSGVQYLLGGGGMGDYQPAAAQSQVEAQGGVYAPTASYATLPLDNLRTKDQLIDVARQFERMANTVYEMADQTDTQIAAAGTGQPGAHYVNNGMHYRHSLSPPGTQLTSAHEVAIAAASSQQSNGGSTPVLSTPSSTGGYTSGHSPESNPRLSPATPGATMYPTLPGPSTAGYGTSSMAPTATLGTQHQNDYRPRHGGGYLQKAAPMRAQRQEDEMDISEDNSATPKNASSPRAPVAQMRPSASFSNPNIDPALSGEEAPASAPPADGEEPRRKSSAPVDSAWVESIRTIEALRKYVSSRLENGDYEDNAAETKQEETETQSLYPILSGVQVGA